MLCGLCAEKMVYVYTGQKCQCLPKDAIEMVGNREIEQRNWRLKVVWVQGADTKGGSRRRIRDRGLSGMLGCACHEQKARSRESCSTDKNSY